MKRRCLAKDHLVDNIHHRQGMNKDLPRETGKDLLTLGKVEIEKTGKVIHTIQVLEAHQDEENGLIEDTEEIYQNGLQPD